MKNKYIVENKNGDWLHAFFSKEEAEEAVKHLKRNDERMGKKESYRIKTPGQTQNREDQFPTGRPPIQVQGHPEGRIDPHRYDRRRPGREADKAQRGAYKEERREIR